MVTEKDADVEHDFMKDPIRLERKGEWLGVKACCILNCTCALPRLQHLCLPHAQGHAVGHSHQSFFMQ